MQSCAFAHKTNIVFFMLSLSSSSWLLKLPSDKILALGVEGLSGGLMDQWISLFKSGLETFISSLFY